MSIVLECETKGGARFACAQAGCRECEAALLEENLGLVYWMVKQLEGGGRASYADLVQEGWIGLWKAIEHYEEGRGVRFSSYACVVIKYQLWQAVMRSQKAAGWLEDEKGEADLDRVVRVWQEAQSQQALGEELEILPQRLREVIELHYGLSGGEPQNLAEIGRGWGLTRERIRQLHEQALGLLRLPAFSIRLRGLCERGKQRHYRQTLHQHQRQQRKLRRRA
jgi:RNA polymerase sigma factor (sigma-70 family)